MAVTGQAMNSNSAVFGLCNPESGYGSPGQGYPSVTSEHLSAFYAGSGGSSAPGSGGSSSGGGGGSSGEPSSPSPYGAGGGGGVVTQLIPSLGTTQVSCFIQTLTGHLNILKDSGGLIPPP